MKVAAGCFQFAGHFAVNTDPMSLLAMGNITVYSRSTGE
jgi:hypothetical protein